MSESGSFGGGREECTAGGKLGMVADKWCLIGRVEVGYVECVVVDMLLGGVVPAR